MKGNMFMNAGRWLFAALALSLISMVGAMSLFFIDGDEPFRLMLNIEFALTVMTIGSGFRGIYLTEKSTAGWSNEKD